jgi:dolichol-phosphate mannosyltransferase
MGLISIIVPVAARVHRQVLHTKQLESLASKVSGHDFEFIFVDDGSHHEPLNILFDKAKNDKRYRVITLTRNFGPAAAFLAGITYASGDCAGYFSGRYLDPCQVFRELIRHWEANARVVLGKWADPQLKSTRLGDELNSRSIFQRKLNPNRISFQDISSILFDKEAYDIFSQITDPSSDMIEILAWAGFKSHLVEYSIQSVEGVGRRLTFNDRVMRLEYSESLYSLKSFQTSLSIGLFLAVLGALTTIGLIVASEYYQRIVPDWWILSGVIVFIIGVQLGLMGVFGGKLFRSLERIHSRPAFIVDSMVNPPISTSLESREKIEKMILSLWSVRKQKIDYASSKGEPPAENETEE